MVNSEGETICDDDSNGAADTSSKRWLKGRSNKQHKAKKATESDSGGKRRRDVSIHGEKSEKRRQKRRHHDSIDDYSEDEGNHGNHGNRSKNVQKQRK